MYGIYCAGATWSPSYRATGVIPLPHSIWAMVARWCCPAAAATSGKTHSMWTHWSDLISLWSLCRFGECRPGTTPHSFTCSPSPHFASQPVLCLSSQPLSSCCLCCNCFVCSPLILWANWSCFIPFFPLNVTSFWLIPWYILPVSSCLSALISI